jgi:TolA-binding protein
VGDDGAAAYANAMQLFREGRYDGAASGFHAFALAHAQASQAEDASFLEAVSLAQAGDFDAAAAVAEHHLEAFPRSFRRRDAAALVVRAVSRRQGCDAARSVLVRWMGAGAQDEIEAALRTCRDPVAATR